MLVRVQLVGRSVGPIPFTARLRNSFVVFGSLTNVQRNDGEPVVPAHVEAILCDHPDVEFAVVFGSRVASAARPSSDLDVAVKFSEALSAEDRFRLRCRLSSRLQRDDAQFVDVSDVEDLPVEVAHEAVSGELLCGDEEAFQKVHDAIEAEFADRRDEIERRQRSVIRRIADDGI